ncbi:MAG TPA: hypothetical protein VER55_13660 [Ardenticatenaceae bacterium]|nr:hypothetical protein [Ardenticatenaceae bacterium]
MPSSEKTQLRHPDSQKEAPRISTEKYEAVRAAILEAVPHDEEGIPFKDLDTRVASLLPQDALEALGSVGWYTTSVKLDLEARGLIERVPGARPQRLRRVQSR